MISCTRPLRNIYTVLRNFVTQCVYNAIKYGLYMYDLICNIIRVWILCYICSNIIGRENRIH